MQVWFCTFLIAVALGFVLLFNNNIDSKNTLTGSTSNTNNISERNDEFYSLNMTLICGEEFRKRCNFDYNESNNSVVLINEVKAGIPAIVFVQPSQLQSFLKQQPFPELLDDYFLLTHNSDCAVPEVAETEYLGSNIRMWFAQNNHSKQTHSTTTSHIKRTPIVSLPIGIANPEWGHGNVSTIREFISPQSWSFVNKRPHLLYVNFSVHTFKEERGPLLQQFISCQYCLSKVQHVDFRSYLKELSSCSFVLCPRGNGLDCHRTWEALLIGTIPVVRTSPLDRLFEHLPVVIVQDWNEVNVLFLQKKLVEISQGCKKNEYEFQRLSFDYWWKQIESYQNVQPK
jgi:hypothetical protein